MTTADRAEVGDVAQQSLQLLERARSYLADGDLHQASEKAWALPLTWPRPSQQQTVGHTRSTAISALCSHNAWLQTGDDRIRELRGIPNDLHGYYYVRKRFLDAKVIAADIESVAELVDILAPLTGVAPRLSCRLQGPS